MSERALPLSSRHDMFRRMWRVLRRWHQRHTQRLHLDELDDHRLKDLGLTREAVGRECAKPFWRR